MHGQTLLDRLEGACCRGDCVGDSCRAIAEQHEIAPSTVVKWSKRVRETGSAAPAKFGGYRTCTLEPHRDFVMARLEEVPHLTLHKLKDLLAARGIAVSHDTVWRFLRREGRSFKKTAFASEQHRDDARRGQRIGFESSKEVSVRQAGASRASG